MRAIIELGRQRRRDIELLGHPVVTVAGDVLTAAGCIRSLEGGSIHLGEYGRALNIDRAWARGDVEIIDTTCPIIELAVTAGAHGIPYIPIRGGLDSQVTGGHPNFLVMKDPFEGVDRLVVPAINPDYLVISALRADAGGNIVVRRTIDEGPLVKASKIVIAFAEQMVSDVRDGLTWEEEIISGIWVDVVVPLSPEQSDDTNGWGRTNWTPAQWARYAEASASDETMQQILAEMGIEHSLAGAR